MNDQIKNFLEVSKGIWASLGSFQKASILAIGLLCASGLGAIVYYGSQPQWHPLYSGVDHENMAKIRDVLMDESVEYRLTMGGTAIEVPAQHVTEMKLKVKSQKDIIINGGSADPLDYIETIPMGMAQEEKKIAFLKAQQQSLEAQINQMPKVISSDVSLNIPKRRPFEKLKESSASVMLKIRSGDYISPTQVESIRHLISSAVHNLNPKNVTVVDSNGRLLARFSDEASNQGTMLEDSRREMKAKLEHHLQRKVQDILAPAVGGVDRVVAQIDIELLHQQEKRTIEAFKKTDSVPTTEEVITETTEGATGSDTASGATGTAGNGAVKISVSNPEGGEVTNSSNNLSRNTSKRTFIVPKTTSEIFKDGAEIKKMTVAVNVASPADTEWGPAQIAKFEELVKNAVGWVSDPATGRMDTISVMETKFNLPTQVVTASPAIEDMVDQVDHYMDTNIARNIMGAALLLALLLFYKKIFASEKIESQDMVSGEESIMAASAGGELIEGGTLENLQEEAEIAMLENEFSKEMDALKEATSTQPQTIATVIENWVMKETN